MMLLFIIVKYILWAQRQTRSSIEHQAPISNMKVQLILSCFQRDEIMIKLPFSIYRLQINPH